MRLGTPGFVASRLVEAREARGITQLALADQVNIKRASIGNYEQGDATPSPDVLERIATVTGLPIRFFVKPDRAPKRGPSFMRALRSASPVLCDRAEINAKWAGDIAHDLSDDVALPAVDFPSFGIMDPATLTGEHIEELAVQARRHWGLGDGPISNVVWLLENKGAVVTRCELGEPRLDGLSHWRGDRPTILLASDHGSGSRSRFDAAHELGHLLLHVAVEATRLRSGSEWRLFENQAHQFAGAFLFPKAAFMQEVMTFDLDALQPLKPHWKVSMKMMVKRAANLGFMTVDRERQLMINYNRRGYRTNEPLESAVAIEQPRLLRRAVELLSQEQGIDSLLDRIALGNGDFERLTGVPPRTLSAEGGVVVMLRRPSPAATPSLPVTERDGAVLPFPSPDRNPR